MEFVLAALLGFAGGAVGGMLGVGGGILFVPAIAIFLDEPQVRAVATSLVAVVGVGIVGAWRQDRYGNVRWRDGLVIGALAPLGVLGGVVLSNAVSDRTLEVGFALLLLAVAAQLVLRVSRAPGHP
jgi:uncharacterized membrane protein YfcA